MDALKKKWSKYLIFASAGKSKEVLTKYKNLWDGVKSQIETINEKPGEYGKDFMKITFNSHDDLPLNKILKLHNLAIIFKCFFQEDNKYYPQLFVTNVCMSYKNATIWKN